MPNVRPTIFIGITAAEYERNLGANLADLPERAKSGRYVAPPVRRAYSPKGKHEKGTLGIPTLEDKVLQRAIVMLLEPVYEQDFRDCSHGFRPQRSPHTTLDTRWKRIMGMGGCWRIDADFRKFFDPLVKSAMRDILNQRIGDGVIRRLVSTWLHAGVMEDGVLMYPEAGTPQGGVISPRLSDIYLHEVLPKRFEKYGLNIHPENPNPDAFPTGCPPMRTAGIEKRAQLFSVACAEILAFWGVRRGGDEA